MQRMQPGRTRQGKYFLSCDYCNNNTHENCDGRALTEEGKTLNTYQCPHCKKKKYKHPTAREEERVEKVNEAEDEI